MPDIFVSALSLSEITERSIAAGKSLFKATVNPPFNQNVWYDVPELTITTTVPENSVAFIQFQSSINPDEPYGTIRRFEQRFVVDGNSKMKTSIDTYTPDTDDWNQANYYFPLCNVNMIQNLTEGSHTFKVEVRTTDSISNSPDHSEAKHIVTILKR